MSKVKDSSFNEGQDDEEVGSDDGNGADDEAGEKIAYCMLCDDCARVEAQIDSDDVDVAARFMVIKEYGRADMLATRRENEQAASRQDCTAQGGW